MKQSQSVPLLLIVLPLHLEASYASAGSPLLQHEVCSYTPSSHLLSCTCPQGGEGLWHHLSMQPAYFIREQGLEINTVEIKSCENLALSLDFGSINPTDVKFSLSECGTVSIEEVTFDPLYADKQLLSLEVNTVLKLILENLSIDEALQMSAENVKKILVSNVTFSHITENGISLNKTDTLSIKDSVFERIGEGSIRAVDSKDIVILNNRFNINAVEVITASKGSKLYISCNRLLEAPINPECVSTSTLATSIYTETTSESSSQSTKNTLPTETYSPEVSEKQIKESLVTVELIVGVTVGGFLILLILLVVIIFIFCKRKRKSNKLKNVEETNESEQNISFVTAEDKTEVNGIQDTSNNESDNGDSPLTENIEETQVLIDDSRPRFSSPVWLSDIHNNEIFNKQKSMNNNPEKEARDETMLDNGDTTPKRKDLPVPVKRLSRVIDGDLEMRREPQENNSSQETTSDEITSTISDNNTTPETDL